MGWSLIHLENSHIVHKSQMLSDVHTVWSILRPLDYDSVRPPSGWYARANIGVKWDHESTALSVKYTKIYFFLPSQEICISYQRLSQKGHFVGKFTSLDAAIIHPHAWRRETPGMLPLPHGDTAITSDQPKDSDQEEWYVTKILWTLPTSCVRYHDL